MANELYHYGRKGMKWYQTIFSKQSSGGPSTTKYGGGSDGKSKAASSKSEMTPKRDIKKMSNQELQDIISRINLEKQYKQLMAEMSVKKKSKFAEMTRKILVDVATELSKEYLKQKGKDILKLQQTKQKKGS